MSPFSSCHVFLLWTFVCVLLLNPACGDNEGFKLCVTSTRGIKDLSHKNLTSVPSDVSNQTQFLDLSFNFIQSLRGEPFSRLSQLCFLKITHCGLLEISAAVFSHISALKVLNISHNKLPFIPEILSPELNTLDLSGNLYPAYELPTSFQNLSKLQTFVLGSVQALSVRCNDFLPLRNASLSHLVLGAGIHWQSYESGSLAKIKSLKTFSLHASFCENFDMFEDLLIDLNATQAKSLKFVRVFPDSCHVRGDLFRNLRTMPFLQNLTIENTWINTSFMEMFLKNVWLSSIYDLSFINMTYNEDTPDGFQFPTINHTINLYSITFNGINHYQYRYPTFNISLQAIKRLTYLKFSGTGMNILPCRLISILPSLETLDLSDNLLTESGFWWIMCPHTSVFTKLRQLSLSNNRFSSLSIISREMHRMSTVESLDLSFNSIQLDGLCSWPEHLTKLSLANNNLGNSIFTFLSSHFESIDLSKTGITSITEEDLARFTKLTHLALSSNSIQVLPDGLGIPSLLSLHVDQNAITSISREALSGFPRLQTLKAGSNPFVCSCESYWFLTAFNKSQLLDWPLDYSCSTPRASSGLLLSEYKPSRMSCEVWLQAAVALPVMATIFTIIGVVFIKCDGAWYSKMLWVWIRMKRRGRKRSKLLNDVSFSYHSFISYSNKDLDWVDGQLVPALEGAGFSLCIHERDFVPGEWIIDNIINCVESSYKTLFVLSKHFVQSEWCNYELFFAQHRAVSVKRDSLVFILLEPIPADSLPRKFLRLRTLLRQQTYLEWPSEERKRRVFWASLRSMLHMADKSVVLKNVAVDISETVALVSQQE